jgi:prepilin-type N-terminal cleavage/methylation domain-containing protein
MHIYKKFTLVELMIVTGVIAIIVSIALPGLYRAKVSTQESSTIAALRAIVSTQSVFS